MSVIEEISTLSEILITPVLLNLTLLILFFIVSTTSLLDAIKSSQLLLYCKHQLDKWDPKKITVACYIRYIVQTCTTEYQIITNILASILNVFLFYKVILQIHPTATEYVHNVKNLAKMLPLFFLFQMYYTDVLRLTMILAFMYISIKRELFWATSLGFCAVLISRTNAIYIFMFGGMQAVRLFCTYYVKRYGSDLGDYGVSEMDFYEFLGSKDHRQRFITACSYLPKWVVSEVLVFATLGLAFVGFTYFNEGIVFGDEAPAVHVTYSTTILFFTLHRFLCLALFLETHCNVLRNLFWKFHVVCIGDFICTYLLSSLFINAFNSSMSYCH